MRCSCVVHLKHWGSLTHILRHCLFFAARSEQYFMHLHSEQFMFIYQWLHLAVCGRSSMPPLVRTPSNAYVRAQPKFTHPKPIELDCSKSKQMFISRHMLAASRPDWLKPDLLDREWQRFIIYMCCVYSHNGVIIRHSFTHAFHENNERLRKIRIHW